MNRQGSRLAVIICTYTNERLAGLGRAIRSVLRQSRPPDELIVVVDHNEALLARVTRDFREVVVIDNWQAPGLSGARNSGIAAAGAELIAFIDDDAEAAPDWLERLELGFQDNHVFGVGGYVEAIWEERRPRWFPEEFDWVVGCSYRGLPEAAGNVRNLLGCNMAFRREVFQAVGGFRTGIGRIGTYPSGCEETELCIRAGQALQGQVLRYDPEVQVRHQVPPTRASWDYFRSRCYAEGLSKALITRFVGKDAGLSSERRHALRTLPRGLVRNFAGALIHRDPWRVVQGGVIAAGLGLAVAGFMRGRWSSVISPAAVAGAANRDLFFGDG
jgi:glycosyltransferase involved in cell wall biosynthesis